MTDVPRLDVRAESAPDPHLLRSAVSARVAGLPWPAGPERTVADAVAAAVREATTR